jgi:hypothetical protein
MTYFFIKPLSKELDNELIKTHSRHSSDLAINPEGYIVTDEELNRINKDDYELYIIPNVYQNFIIDFVEDFWDGDVIIQKART